MNAKIVLIPGDGIGPEIVGEAKKVLEHVAARYGHTFSFTEESDLMTLSFFGEEYRKALAFCGAKSGRDVDKAAECGLTPVFEETDDGTAAYFDEADTVLVTRKLYARPLDRESFTDPSCLGFYENAGLHTVYVCEIEKALVK